MRKIVKVGDEYYVRINDNNSEGHVEFGPYNEEEIEEVKRFAAKRDLSQETI